MTRIEKVELLATYGATVGERQAATAALRRINVKRERATRQATRIRKAYATAVPTRTVDTYM